ncbi:MAG: Sialate O-acetylesterase [Bacteroidetes bacterium]|jgi:sialate O-acetylesterase|nr:Sialate O-acetylesterase [Bacteroidota bacterium]
MKRTIIAFLSFFSLTVSAQWAFRLPAIISNHAVFQQSANVKLWGWAQSGSTVKICCSWNPSDTVKAEPGKDWTWEAAVKTPKAGGPYTITFISSTQKVVVSDILIGEVWLCSGQSNMEYAFNWAAGVLDAGDAVAKSTNNELRYFQLAHTYSNFPVENSDGEWKISSPETTPSMSVAGYFFGKTLNQRLKVPVGLIASYWGGTSVQAWTPQEVYQKDPELKKAADRLNPVNWSPVEPSVIYNSMLFPLKNYRIAGAIWYQGEANTEHPEDYGKLFEGLITGWREAFDNDFPFYYVQIAPWSGYWGISSALLREQQEKTLKLPKTGLISVADLVDDISDIHPRIKKEVGMRLINLALTEQYGVTGLQPYFPKYAGHSIKKDKVTISLKSLGRLTCKAKTPANFEISGADKKFYPAVAKIETDGSIALSSKYVKVPVAVRYCFTNDGVPDLFDTNGLPLLPFRTDDWNSVFTDKKNKDHNYK